MKKINKFGFLRIAIITTISVVFAATVPAQSEFKKVADGAPFKIKGIIAVRGADSLVIRDVSSEDRYQVRLDPSTDVKTYKKLIRGGKEYASSYLLRGLRVQVSGTGDGEGQVVAKEINFDEDDLRSAQALQVTVDPLEARGKETAEKLSGQIDETQAMAANAQATADRANNRINGLNEFEPVKTIVVNFATGNSSLDAKNKAVIDEAAAWVKTHLQTLPRRKMTAISLEKVSRDLRDTSAAGPQFRK